MNIRHRAVAVVIHEDSLLVIKRLKNDQSYYVFPGGGIEAGESAQKAAERELWEETSIRGEVIKPIHQLEVDDGVTMTAFLCRYLSGEPALGDFSERAKSVAGIDTYEPMWIPLKNLPSNLFPSALKLIITNHSNTNFDLPIKVDRVSRYELQAVNRKFR